MHFIRIANVLMDVCVIFAISSLFYFSIVYHFNLWVVDMILLNITLHYITQGRI